jgi:5-methylthioadenosine/S-adenosylhomocysteine deaminase
MAATSVDLLISARWIIPIIPKGKVFEDCTVVIDQGKIIALSPTAEATRKYAGKEHVELGQQALLPGLVNSHGHAAMTLLRGYADDLPLHTWLEKHIWPAEAQWVSPDFVRDGTELAIAEMIRSGTTCFSDMYFFPDIVTETVNQTGIRSQIAFPIFDFPSAWGRGPDDYIHKGLQLHDDHKDRDLIRIAFGPHSPYTLSNEPMEKVAIYAEELDTCIQIHLHETAQEISDHISTHGNRPIERLVEMGLMSPLTQCVHMTQVNDQDITTLIEHNAHVIHCPKSNLKLSSGFSPIAELAKNGINVALGTDGAASNNSLDMFSEMSTAALVAKAVSKNASAISAHKALEMATINGAKAMGWADHIGSIEIGKSADLIAVELGAIESEPLYNLPSQLVYTPMGHQVSHVWVKGTALMTNRALQTLNEHEIVTKAQRWQKQLAQ